MKKLEALKSLYAALGGTASTVAGCTTSLEVLNAILAIGEEDPEAFIADAIAAIAENAESILPQAELIEKTITANGEYAASADNADGYSSVSVDVEPNLTTKSITANGTYTATTDNADGYSSVSVNVPAPTLTGWPMVETLSPQHKYAAVGYYNGAPTQIVCITTASQSDPAPNFIVLGWIYAPI